MGEKDNPLKMVGDTGGGSFMEQYGAQSLQGAVDLVGGLLTPRMDYNFQSGAGLNLMAPPPEFNQGAAQAEIQRGVQYGQSKGGKIGGGIGTALGIALAPLTGGLSIGIGQKLGSAVGGAIGGAVNRQEATLEAQAREAAINRTLGAYRDIRSEADINQAQQMMRAQSLLDYYNR